MDNKLFTPLQQVRGIGSERAQRLQRLELNTASDLLFHFPRDYQDLDIKGKSRKALPREYVLRGFFPE